MTGATGTAHTTKARDSNGEIRSGSSRKCMAFHNLRYLLCGKSLIAAFPSHSERLHRYGGNYGNHQHAAYADEDGQHSCE